MLFKNAAIYQLPADFSISPIDLEAKLAQHQLVPVTPAYASMEGAIEVHEHRFVIHQEGYSLWHYGVESWVLPASVVKEHVEEACEAYEQARGFKPGKKAKLEMKEEAIQTLRAQSFKKKKRVAVMLDHDRRRLAVDTSSWSGAENAVSFLRKTLESLPAVPLSPLQALELTMTNWVRMQTVSPSFELYQSFEINRQGNGPRISYDTYAENSEDVQKHLIEGMTASRVALRWRDDLTLTLNDKGMLKRIRSAMLKEESEPESFEAGMLIAARNLFDMADDLIVTIGGIEAPK